MLLSDFQLLDIGLDLINPFSVRQNRLDDKGNKIISWGLSSYGYDVRVADEYKLFHNIYSALIDPKDFSPSNFITMKGECCVIPPNSFALCNTIEYVRVPRDCVSLVMAKSTYARCGLVVNATILEPGWEGQVTLELSNTTPSPIKVYSNEGIVQLIFIRGDEACDVSYADRIGKYQYQKGITLPLV